MRAGELPAEIDLAPAAWPALAAHVARVERVREMVARAGASSVNLRFAGSPHAVERAALLDDDTTDLAAVEGVLACAVDEWLAYGHFLSRLVELGVAKDPDNTVAAYERFVTAASNLEASQPSWLERMRVARDGLAALYVRVGRLDDAEALYQQRHAEEPTDVSLPIGAARAFLEAGETLRAMAWLERAADRAAGAGREELRARLVAKQDALRKRVN